MTILPLPLTSRAGLTYNANSVTTRLIKQGSHVLLEKMMLKFSKANAKITRLKRVKGLKQYLAGNRKVYSFDMRSGHTCPYAKDCRSSAVEQPDGSLRIVDG